MLTETSLKVEAFPGVALRFQSCGSSQGCASSPTFPRTISPFSVLQVPLNLVQGESSGGLVLPSGGDIVVLVLPDSHYLPPNNTPPPSPSHPGQSLRPGLGSSLPTSPHHSVSPRISAVCAVTALLRSLRWVPTAFI